MYEDEDSISLPAHKREEFVAKISATVDYVLESMVGDRPSSIYWRPRGEKKGVSYYVDDNVNPDQYRFCCVSETSARTEDVMKLFLMTDTETLLKNYRIVYNNVLDARVLSVLEHPTTQNPYKSVYLRYSSFATPKLMDNRDMCLVVATDMFTHEDGSTVGYCLWDSIEIPECPDMSKSHGVVRSRMFRSGFFCRTDNSVDSLESAMNDGKNTKIVYLVGLEPGGVAPRLAAKLVVEKFGANLARLCEYFRRKNLDPATFRPRSEWPSSRDATHCRSCTKHFGGFSLRQHCAACGEVFCRACCTKEKTDLPGVGITTLRFCHKCLGKRGIDTYTPQRVDSPKSSTSTSLSSAAAARRTSGQLQSDHLVENGTFLLRSSSNLAASSAVTTRAGP